MYQAGSGGIQKERAQWALDKARLIKDKEDADLEKLATNKQTAEALNKVSELMSKLAEIEARPATQDEWFAAWKKSKACETFVNQISSAAQKMGQDDALKRLKEALAKSHPSFSWSEAMASYKALQEVEDQTLLAELNINLSEDSEEAVDAEEEAIGEDQQPEVARSEELAGSTNEQADPPTT